MCVYVLYRVVRTFFSIQLFAIKVFLTFFLKRGIESCFPRGSADRTNYGSRLLFKNILTPARVKIRVRKSDSNAARDVFRKKNINARVL